MSDYILLCIVFILQALERISFGGTHVRETVIAQSRILLFWYCTTYLLMEKNKPKYQQLVAAPLEQTQPSAVQLEPINTEQVEEQEQPDEPVTPKQVELDQPLESPPIDQDPPFILEGL